MNSGVSSRVSTLPCSRVDPLLLLEELPPGVFLVWRRAACPWLLLPLEDVCRVDTMLKNFDALADFEILEMFRTCYVNVVCVRCTLLTPQVQLWVGE